MPDKKQTYPKSITLPDGSKIEFHLMTAADKDAMLAFARKLPEEDMLFLRIDIAKEEGVDSWLANIKSGATTTLVAFDADGLVGYAAVHQNTVAWTRRVGELRVNVSQDYRSRGLGKNLISDIFSVARAAGLKKLVANMMSDQHGAQAAFRRLGFVPEAVLADHVEDRNGMARDLVIMSYFIDGHSDSIDEPVRI
ncbi:MAG: L-amino acid N-acyltransferase YncA [Candidatus Pseudothioglobus sp.]|jgi:L-amino acid N-acyltransferase YncA